MLDTETKRRIDTARDILVGKLPDPKSQVEQITIALIYKFMDDMDARSEEFGGERTFFDGDFQKYGWARLMRGGLGGHEMLGLYSEAITRMPENPGIPPLFRDIFKNAYLPYRDPETLRAFLKVIDDFEYDHSERLGDAFEYLLSVLGSQGDAGQFRTPRHIIDFIVSIVDPKKDETVLDPACGTAGFLISAYKHILKANTDADGNTTLTPDDRERLAANFRGYDISPDMVRLSLVNMYLHGFPDPQIHEYDTLTSLDRWNEHADVILANPPFMSPKGGIQPHTRFSVQSKRSEVLFVDYIAEHLTPNGRAGIVVPEGIIFQSQAAYAKLRRMLVEDFLVGVISLPSGVFMPYTGVKTSILILDRAAARRNSSVLLSDIQHIGFSLGVKRTPTERNDLPEVVADYIAQSHGGQLSPRSKLVGRAEILASGADLRGSRYRSAATGRDVRVALGDLCEITKGTSSSTKTSPGPYPLIVTAAKPRTSTEFQLEGPAVCVPLISSLGHGKAAVHRIHYVDGPFALANLLVALQPRSSERIQARYLYHALNGRRLELAGLMRGAANVSMKPDDLASFEIPVPPIAEQRRIAAELDSYTTVIDAAREVIRAYTPHVVVQPDWPVKPLGELAEVRLGKMLDGSRHKSGRLLPYVRNASVQWGRVETDDLPTMYFEDHELERYALQPNDVLVCEGGEPGRAALWDGRIPDLKYQKAIHRVRFNVPFEPAMLVYLLQELALGGSLDPWLSGTTIKHLTLQSLLRLPIPVPPLTVQKELVLEIEAERAAVEANRQLVQRIETKLDSAVAAIWG